MGGWGVENLVRFLPPAHKEEATERREITNRRETHR